MQKCSTEAVIVRMIDVNKDGIVTSKEYASAAIQALRREALRLIRNGNVVTHDSFLSKTNTSITEIQANAAAFRKSTSADFMGVIQDLSASDAEAIANAAASLRVSVKDAGVSDRISATWELLNSKIEFRAAFSREQRHCNAER